MKFAQWKRNGFDKFGPHIGIYGYRYDIWIAYMSGEYFNATSVLADGSLVFHVRRLAPDFIKDVTVRPGAWIILDAKGQFLNNLQYLNKP